MNLGRQTCRIDLLAEIPCPPDFHVIDPIRLSVSALRDKFFEIAKAEGFGPADFREAILDYEFPPFRDDYCSNCRVSITNHSGYSVTKAVDCIGNGADIITQNTEPGIAPNDR